MKTYKILILFFIITISSYAQVSITLQQPPPFQFKVEHLWKVTLTNMERTSYNVYLHARVTETTQGQIMEATSSVFSLQPGIKFVSPRELVPLDIKETNPKYANVIKNIGGLPTGNYEICLTVINAENGFELGTQCIYTQVQNLTQVQLLSPEMGATFSILGGGKKNGTSDMNENIFGRISTGSFINFNWMPPTPITPGARTTYKLRIVEIYGRQSPYDAMRSNPALFENSKIVSTIFQYPAAAKPFEAGKSYAWKIDVYLDSIFISESETWDFSFKDNSPANKKSGLTLGIRPPVKQQTLNEEKKSLKNRPLFIASLAFKPELFLRRNRNTNKEDSDIPAFKISGGFKFNTIITNHVPLFSQQDKVQATAVFNPVITIYGLPFSANILLSSQEDENRQNINSFGLNFDFNFLRESLTARLDEKIAELESSSTGNLSEDSDEMKNLADPSNLADNLDKYDLISGTEKFFMSILSFGIGTNYPEYSEYTLSGVPVTGLNIEINPGIFYGAFTASLNQDAIENDTYKRKLYSGRLGLGKKDGTHIFFTGLFAKDNEGSITVDPLNLTLTPKDNYVFGIEGKLNLFEDVLSLQGEGAFSALTRDTRDPVLSNNSIPGWLQNLIDPRVSTSADYSYSGKLSYNNDASATKISLGIKMVGTGFASLGVPNLRTDQLGYEGKFDQRLFEQSVTIGTFYKRYKDNLINWKQSTTTSTAYGINLGFTFPDIPYLRLSYSPYFQENDDPNPLYKMDNTTSIYSVTTGYSYPIGNVNSSTSFTFSGQQAKTLNSLGDFKTNSFMISEFISLTIPLSFSASWSLVQNSSAFGDSRFNNFDFGANAQVNDWCALMGGVNVAVEQGVNNRTGFFLSSYFTPDQWINIDLRIERNVYTEQQFLYGDYREFIFSFNLQTQW